MVNSKIAILVKDIKCATLFLKSRIRSLKYELLKERILTGTVLKTKAGVIGEEKGERFDLGKKEVVLIDFFLKDEAIFVKAFAKLDGREWLFTLDEIESLEDVQ